LILLTLLVLLAHGLVLGGLPDALRLWPGAAGAPALPEPLRFNTRTIEPPPEPVPVALAPARAVPPRPAPPAARARLAPAATVAVAGPDTAAVPNTPDTSNAADSRDASDAAVAATAALPAATDPTAPTTADSNKAPAEKVPPTSPATPATSAASASSAPSHPVTETAAVAAPRLQPPAAVRMLFDGRGEERGFIKYAASAELLWLPMGDSYSARLEISAWGIRLRTWTSKGALDAAGLLPTRFGDKPRGAEQATHFQRDKGIISFSANNPDVPLQAGAQDKLSALLQLSALVAGAPEQYRSGTTVSFQAADAHRAEQWNFVVGALEPLDLPGGTMPALKLGKEPTLEFDQRIEVWLAPSAHYLPVRLRITEANGAFADLLWRGSQIPEQ
jgi:hypothetical protein